MFEDTQAVEPEQTKESIAAEMSHKAQLLLEDSIMQLEHNLQLLENDADDHLAAARVLYSRADGLRDFLKLPSVEREV